MDDVDSISAFDASNVDAILEKAKIGTTDAQTLYMNIGLQRTNMLKYMLKLAEKANSFIFMTAHVDDKVEIGGGPGIKQKSLQTMKAADNIKGVPGNGLFLFSQVIQIIESRPFNKTDTRTPMLPKDSHDNATQSTDLMRMNIIILRSKISESGRQFAILSSQSKGIQASLSEFYHIKYTLKNYGIEGTSGMTLDLLPDRKFGRTTVRALLDKDEVFARAIQVTSDMAQLEERFHSLVEKYGYTPKGLRTALIKEGYDMEKLLAGTRNWQTLNNVLADEATETRTLITFDWYRLAAGEITLKQFKK
jgi:hypothetical protein